MYPGDMPPVDESALNRIRPKRATTAGVLLIVIGALGMLLSLVILAGLGYLSDSGASVNSGYFVLFIVQIAMSAFQIASGIFALQGKSWARIAGIVICSITIAGNVINVLSGGTAPGLIGIALNGWVVATLSHPDVRAWCRY
jgi:hypothetical protein